MSIFYVYILCVKKPLLIKEGFFYAKILFVLMVKNDV